MTNALYTDLISGGTGEAFDRHVFAAVIATGFAPPERLLTDTLALSLPDLTRLFTAYFPHRLDLLDVHPRWSGEQADELEEPSLRALLYNNHSPETNADHARWLARIIARRSLGTRHLWEDLGLTRRAEIGDLMRRHFAPLAARNPGMRWKKFFYRTLCEQEGVLLCKAPNCQDCADYRLCFPPPEVLAAEDAARSANPGGV
ncbi:nitrogen fixation protein NifQ [Rhodovibrio salinarum]|uniref:Nitrogen fixation protein NifQ n=1 Tax=Rhodovibrio salinarum TaxID=1087 RepID=A0A934QLL9_9PROT|nr:nitrogen fixation protein NifQ [Rhodovibrio salinarum]MBK1698987.1 nitrogen fixation protein NifQ [Rhodovibrio salinarum]